MPATRLWFNRTYATTWHLIGMIRANPDGRAVHVLGSHTDGSSPVLAACDQTLIEPRLDPDAYVEWALEVARVEQIDVFVPRANMGALSAARDRFAAIGTRLMCPEADTVELFDDKATAYQAAAALGLPVPPHRVVHTGTELHDAYFDFAAIADQVCMKPVRGVGGEGYRRLTTDPVRWRDDLAHELRSLVRLDDACRALDDAGPRDVLIMPFLDGLEVSVDVLADERGHVLAAVGRQHDDQPGRRLRTIVDHAPAREVATALTGAHRVAYLSNTQVKYWQGRPYLLELNTRAAGGIFQTALAGVNLPWAAIQLALDETPDPIRPRWGANYTEVASYVEIGPSR
jgi:biotin carboxylase